MTISRMIRSVRRDGLMQAILRTSPFREQVFRAFAITYYHQRLWETTRWMGVPTLKFPGDTWSYQEIIFETRPDLIIECGTHSGGSALYLATLLDFLQAGRIITIDIDDRPGRPVHPRIEYWLGSSVSDETLAKVRAAATSASRVMIILDSDHSEGHVLQELESYAPLVTVGCYMVAEDSNINGHPVAPNFGPGPMEALQRFLPRHPEFKPDSFRERLGITFNPGGYLRRV